MKNYKIIEKRPVLTKEQIEEGMNFNRIKNNIHTPKKVFFKPLIVVGFVGIIAIGSLIIINYIDNNSNTQKDQLIPIDSINAHVDSGKKYSLNEKTNLHSESSINTSANKQKSTQEEIKPEKKMQVDAPNHSEELENLKSPDVDTSVSEKANREVDTTSSAINNLKNDANPNLPTKTTSNYSCKILKPGNFCAFADSLNLPYTRNCYDCAFAYLSCKEVNKNNLATGVWLTLKVTKISSLEVKNHFENITLIKAKTGKEIHPFAIAGFDRKAEKEKYSRYLSSDFRAKRFIAYYRKRVDLILLFTDAEAGDKIIIDKTIEAEIQN